MRSHKRSVVHRIGVAVGFCAVLAGCNAASTVLPPTPPASSSTVAASARVTPTAPVTATGSGSASVTPSAPAPSASSRLPALTLAPGTSYFSLDGQPGFVLSRNPTGKTQADFRTVLEWARQGGTKLIRVHLTHGWWGDPWVNRDWSVNEAWARDWDGFFDEAQADGIYVMPVIGVWADWNDGTPDWGSPLWQYNPLNAANGGPVGSPAELFERGSDVQNHWLEWTRTLVARWQGRQNIAAWEIFSELNIASGPSGSMDPRGGVSEPAGRDFTNKAIATVHAADSHHRPVTVSLAGVYSATDKWADFYNLPALDFIELHPYSDTLDRALVKEVRDSLARYKKPTLVGESGLWSMTHDANASTAIRHAVWAGLVSGAMNGRALWDQDGYAIYSASSTAEAMTFMEGYATAELPVARFTSGVSFSGFGPLTTSSSVRVWGAAVGNDRTALGWFRDSSSEPPGWGALPKVADETVTITLPGTAATWQVDFYDTRDGTTLVSSAVVNRHGATVTVALPDFADGIAFKLYAK